MDARSRFILYIICLLIISNITACTPITSQPSEQPSTPPLTWQARQNDLNRLQSWVINGKVAVQTAQDSGSVNVDWVQNRQKYTISIVGALGSNRLKLAGEPNQVTLITSDGKQYQAQNPEQLLAERWGYRLPISSLRYWIRGLPVPNVTYSNQLDSYNRLHELTQQGWQIQYLNYTKVGHLDLPSKITVTSSSLKAKLIIYSWNFSH